MNFFLGLLSCVYFLVGVEGAIRRLCYTYNRVGFVWNSKLSPLDQFTQLQAWKVGGAGTKYFLYEYGEEHGFRHSTNNYWASETMTRAGTKLEEMRDDNKTTAEEFIAMETFYVLANATCLSRAMTFAAANLLRWYDIQMNTTHLLHDRVLECLKKYSGSSKGSNKEMRRKWQQRLAGSEQALQHRSEGNAAASALLLATCNAELEEDKERRFLYEYGEEHGFRHSTNNYWASETMTRAGTKLEEMRDDNKTTAEEFIAMETFYVLANATCLSRAMTFAAANLLRWYDIQMNTTHLLHDRVLECLKKYSGSSRGTNEKTRAKWQQRLQKSEQALQHRSEGKYIESNQLLVVLLPGMLLEMRWGDDPKWYLVRYALLLDDKTKKITKNVTMVVMDGVASGRFKFVPEGKKADDWRYPIFPKFSKDDVVSIIVKMDGHPQVATVVDVKDDHTYTCASGTGKEGSSSGENFELDVFYKQATQVSKTVKKKRKR